MRATIEVVLSAQQVRHKHLKRKKNAHHSIQIFRIFSKCEPPHWQALGFHERVRRLSAPGVQHARQLRIRGREDEQAFPVDALGCRAKHPLYEIDNPPTRAMTKLQPTNSKTLKVHMQHVVKKVSTFIVQAMGESFGSCLADREAEYFIISACASSHFWTFHLWSMVSLLTPTSSSCLRVLVNTVRV